MKTFTYSILAFAMAVSLSAPACSSGDSSDDDNGGNGGGGGSGGSKSGGKSGGSGGTANSGPGAQVPDGDTAEAWKTFLEDGEFRKDGWVADKAEPRRAAAGSPHGFVRVFFNEKLKEAHASTPSVYEVGSVVVKEFYDGDESVGFAAFRKVKDGDEDDAWQVYCAGPAARCAVTDEPTMADPVIGDFKAQSGCASCHHIGSKAGTTGRINTKAPK